MDAAESLILLGSHQPLQAAEKPAAENCGREYVSVYCQARVETKDATTQVSSGDFGMSMEDLLDTPRKLNTATGIPSFMMLNTIVALFTAVSPKSNRQSMSNKKQVIMTFVKLKLNWS